MCGKHISLIRIQRAIAGVAHGPDPKTVKEFIFEIYTLLSYLSPPPANELSKTWGEPCCPLMLAVDKWKTLIHERSPFPSTPSLTPCLAASFFSPVPKIKKKLHSLMGFLSRKGNYRWQQGKEKGEGSKEKIAVEVYGRVMTAN